MLRESFKRPFLVCFLFVTKMSPCQLKHICLYCSPHLGWPQGLKLHFATAVVGLRRRVISMEATSGKVNKSASTKQHSSERLCLRLICAPAEGKPPTPLPPFSSNRGSTLWFSCLVISYRVCMCVYQSLAYCCNKHTVPCFSCVSWRVFCTVFWGQGQITTRVNISLQ